MRILFLSQIIPYPPDAGLRVKTWHVLRHLAGQGHQIVLACFMRPEEERHVAALHAVSKNVFTVPTRRSRLSDLGYWLRTLPSGTAFLVRRDQRRHMAHCSHQIVWASFVHLEEALQMALA